MKLSVEIDGAWQEVPITGWYLERLFGQSQFVRSKGRDHLVPGREIPGAIHVDLQSLDCQTERACAWRRSERYCIGPKITPR